MNIITITSSSVQKLFSNLKTDKALGPDEIRPAVLKQLASELSDILCHFFQQSLDIGVIPEDWKKGLHIASVQKKEIGP